MDLKPEWRAPPGLGLRILQAALQPSTVPVRSPFHGRQSWVASEPGPQPSVLTSLAMAVKGACVLAKTGHMSRRVLGVSCPAPRRGGTPSNVWPASLVTAFSTSPTPGSGPCSPGTPDVSQPPNATLPPPRRSGHTAGLCGKFQRTNPGGRETESPLF